MENKELENEKNINELFKEISKSLSDINIGFKAMNLQIELSDMISEIMLYAAESQNKELFRMLISYYEQQLEILDNLKKEYMK